MEPVRVRRAPIADNLIAVIALKSPSGNEAPTSTLLLT